MPHVDRDAPLASNSDAAMWRQDHDAAIRYIEALLEEREESKAVVEAAKAWRKAEHKYATAIPLTAKRQRAERKAYHAKRILEAVIDAALKEGNDEQNTTQA